MHTLNQTDLKRNNKTEEEKKEAKGRTKLVYDI